MDSRVVRIILNSVHYLVGRRTPQKVELSSGGWAPCSTGFPHYMSILGTHLYQSTRWLCCERLCSASVIFSENSFSTFARFMMGDLQVHLTPLCWVFSSFWSKNYINSMPHSPYSPDLALSDFFFYFPHEKSPQRKMFCWYERGETKNDRSTKRHQNQRVQKLFWVVA